MHKARFELTRPIGQKILSLQCLPIPSLVRAELVDSHEGLILNLFWRSK